QLNEGFAGTAEEIAMSKEVRRLHGNKNYEGLESQLVDPRSKQQVLSDAARNAKIKALEVEKSKAEAMRDWGRFKTAEAQLQQLAKGELPVTGKLREQSVGRTTPTDVARAEGREVITEPPRPVEPSMANPPRYPGEVTAPERYAPQTPRAAEAGAAAEEAAGIAQKRLNRQRGLEQSQEVMLVNMLGEKGTSLDSFTGKPALKSALKEAKEAAANKGYYFPTKPGDKFSVWNLQRIKRSLADDVNATQVEGSLKATQRAEATEVLDNFDSWIKSKSDQYKKADTNWKAESEPIDQMEIGQAYVDALTPKKGTREDVGSFMNVTAPDVVSVKSRPDVKGAQRPIPVSKLSPENVAKRENVRSEINRDIELSDQAKAGNQAMNRVVGTMYDMPKVGILERSVVIANAILKRIEGVNSDFALDVITKKMSDPSEFARMMKA
ncbi:unnamed protein product, partial [marine sediment metagenome]